MLMKQNYVEFQDLGRTISYTRVSDGNGQLPYFSVRKDGQLIGLVSEKYKPIQIQPIVDDIVKNYPDVDVKVFDKKEFTNVVLQLKSYVFNESNPVESELGDIIDFDYQGTGSSVFPAIFISNSYNGMSSLSIDSGLYRSICENGLVCVEDLVYTTRTRHIGKIQVDIKSIETFISSVGEFFETISNPSKVVDVMEVKKLAEKLQLGKRAMKKYIEPVIENLEKISMWAAINLFTYLYVRIGSIANQYQAYMYAQRKLNEFIKYNL